jgi:hypothetical protein
MIHLHGRLVSIFVAPLCGPNPPPAGGYHKIHPMKKVSSTEVVEGKGLVGDRWYGVDKFRLQNGDLKSFSHERQVSLLSCKAAEKVRSVFGIDPVNLRRNLLVDGVKIENGVGKRFKIGDVVLEGTGLCKACKHIEEVNSSPGLVKFLYEMGGLRAKVIVGGIIHEGDEICLV